MEFKLQTEFYPHPKTLVEAEVYTTLHRAKMNTTPVSETRDELHEPIIAEVVFIPIDTQIPRPAGYAIVSFKTGSTLVWSKRGRYWSSNTNFDIIGADQEFRDYLCKCAINEKLRQLKILHDVIDANEKLLEKGQDELVEMSPGAILKKYGVEPCTKS